MRRHRRPPMLLDSDSEYIRNTMQGFIRIQEDILRNPDLSIKQIDDIKELKRELDMLSLQKNNAKMKLGLVDMMNSMN